MTTTTTATALAVLLALAALTAAAPAVADPIEGHWNATAAKDGRSWRFAIDVAPGETSSATVDLTDLATYGIPFTLAVHQDSVRLERKTAEAISVIEGRVGGAQMNGRIRLAGFDAAFTASRGGPTPPNLAEEDVSFANGDVKLAATIIRPAGGGPFPAIVCVHGSGGGDRQYASYRSEGIFYARVGLAALIYDRRGSGRSTGDASTASLEDLADDALRGVALLKTESNVDPTEIGISGFSQGGWIAPLAASRSRDVAFVVVLSASGINPMDQSVYDSENALRRKGYGEDVVARATALRKRMYAFVREGRPDSSLAADFETAYLQPWFPAASLPYPWTGAPVPPGERRFLLFEPAPVWEKVQAPVLGLWGGADQSVPAAESRDIVERALSKGGRTDESLVLYPSADHSLRIVPPKGAAWDFLRAVPGARALIAEWVREHAFRDSGKRDPGSEWTPS